MIYPRHMQSVADVTDHYDELDVVYREVWGEHVHHGFWRNGDETQAEAVEALVALAADNLRLKPGQMLCDIGCGYGAAAEYLARHQGVRVTGVTVSHRQAAAAQARTSQTPGLTFERCDWLENGFADGCFDHAYAIESSEHMADKQRFFDEAFRTLRPGGRLVVCAWLAASSPSPWEVTHLLEPICREGRLPGMGNREDYIAFAVAAGFRVIGFEDLTDRVKRTWTICARRLLGKLVSQPRYIRMLANMGPGNRVFALSLPRLMLAYRTGAMRYGMLVTERD